jgi:hypothetical protein
LIETGRPEGKKKTEMRPITLLVVVAAVIAFGTLAYLNRRLPTPEELEFDKKFDREAVLVKTCGDDPGVASGGPMRVFRFEDKLWYREANSLWRQIDGKVENVCDLLDIDVAHRPPPPAPLVQQHGAVSRLMDLFRTSEPILTPPKEIPPAKPN